MKTARKPKTNSKGDNETKSISMPVGMWLGVEARVQALKATDPDLDFSKYVRRLIRRDVESSALRKAILKRDAKEFTGAIVVHHGKKNGRS